MNDSKSMLHTYKNQKYYEFTDFLNQIETRYMDSKINKLVTLLIVNRNSI